MDGTLTITVSHGRTRFWKVEIPLNLSETEIVRQLGLISGLGPKSRRDIVREIKRAGYQFGPSHPQIKAVLIK